MKKSLFAALLLLVSSISFAQETPTIRVNTNLVQVPVSVDYKGERLYGLKPEQFLVQDNGVEQKIRLDEDADQQGIALFVMVECGRESMMQFGNISGLATMVESIIGGAPKLIAVARYASGPELLQDFTGNMEKTTMTLNALKPCEDGGANTLDAVKYAAEALSQRPSRYRRAILLVGETRDHGSKVKPEAVVEELGRSNVVVDSVSFNPGKTEIVNSLFHGQMGSGPIGLLVMAVNALKKNVPKTLSELSGGEYINFTTQKGFDNGMLRLSNHIHDYYLLSFQPPANVEPGLHRITISIPDYPEAKLRARQSYWAGPTGAQ